MRRRGNARFEMGRVLRRCKRFRGARGAESTGRGRWCEGQNRTGEILPVFMPKMRRSSRRYCFCYCVPLSLGRGHHLVIRSLRWNARWTLAAQETRRRREVWAARGLGVRPPLLRGWPPEPSHNPSDDHAHYVQAAYRHRCQEPKYQPGFRPLRPLLCV
jgi:hypothetical protein